METTARGKKGELAKYFGEMMEEYLTIVDMSPEGKRWLVGDGVRVAVRNDSMRFYGKLDGLGLDEDSRRRLAMQLSFDDNKVAVDIFKNKKFALGWGRMDKAREVTGVSPMKLEDYAASQVDFLVRSGWLNEENGGKVRGIADDALKRYGDKRRFIGLPIHVSAAAIYYAGYKVGEPMSAYNLELVLAVSSPTIQRISDELVRTAFSEEEFLWFKKVKRGSGGWDKRVF